MADGVLLAVPASPAARLLGVVTANAADLARVAYASVAVVTLVVRGLAERGSGLLVPPGELPTIKALTYSGHEVGLGRRAGRRSLGRGRRGGPAQCRPDRGERGAAGGRRGAGGADVRRGQDHPGLGAGRSWSPGRSPAGAARCRSTRWVTPTWCGGCAARSTRCPDWPSRARRTTVSASPPVSARRPRRPTRSPPIWPAAAMAGSAHEGPGDQRHHPLHDVVGVQAVRSARRPAARSGGRHRPGDRPGHPRRRLRHPRLVRRRRAARRRRPDGVVARTRLGHPAGRVPGAAPVRSRHPSDPGLVPGRAAPPGGVQQGPRTGVHGRGGAAARSSACTRSSAPTSGTCCRRRSGGRC